MDNFLKELSSQKFADVVTITKKRQREKLTPLILLLKFRGRKIEKFHLMWLRKQNEVMCHRKNTVETKNELVLELRERGKCVWNNEGN